MLKKTSFSLEWVFKHLITWPLDANKRQQNDRTSHLDGPVRIKGVWNEEDGALALLLQATWIYFKGNKCCSHSLPLLKLSLHRTINELITRSVVSFTGAAEPALAHCLCVIYHSGKDPQECWQRLNHSCHTHPFYLPAVPGSNKRLNKSMKHTNLKHWGFRGCEANCFRLVVSDDFMWKHSKILPSKRKKKNQTLHLWQTIMCYDWILESHLTWRGDASGQRLSCPSMSTYCPLQHKPGMFLCTLHYSEEPPTTPPPHPLFKFQKLLNNCFFSQSNTSKRCYCPASTNSDQFFYWFFNVFCSLK